MQLAAGDGDGPGRGAGAAGVGLDPGRRPVVVAVVVGESDGAEIVLDVVALPVVERKPGVVRARRAGVVAGREGGRSGRAAGVEEGIGDGSRAEGTGVAAAAV